MVPADWAYETRRPRHAGAHRRPAWQRFLDIVTAGTALRFLRAVSPAARSGYPLHVRVRP
jgi:hypothetical protein